MVAQGCAFMRIMPTAPRVDDAGTRVLLLVQDLDIRVINAGTGELIRKLVLNPDKNYQPTGRPSGWPKRNTAPLTRVRGVLDVLRHHSVAGVGFEPT